MQKTPGLIVHTSTWQGDSHGLFDYESRNVYRRSFKVNGYSEGYRLLREGCDVRLLEIGEADEYLRENPSTRPLLSLIKAKSSFYVYPGAYKRDLMEEKDRSGDDGDLGTRALLTNDGNSQTYGFDVCPQVDGNVPSNANDHNQSSVGNDAGPEDGPPPLTTQSAAAMARDSLRLWLLVRSLKGHSVALNPMDTIKLGRYKLKIKEIVTTKDEAILAASRGWPVAADDDTETVAPEPPVDLTADPEAAPLSQHGQLSQGRLDSDEVGPENAESPEDVDSEFLQHNQLFGNEGDPALIGNNANNPDTESDTESDARDVITNRPPNSPIPARGQDIATLGTNADLEHQGANMEMENQGINGQIGENEGRGMEMGNALAVTMDTPVGCDTSRSGVGGSKSRITLDLDDRMVMRCQSRCQSMGSPTSRGRLCRICLLEGEEGGDALICPCACKGTLQWVHLKCLRTWMQGRLNVHGGTNSPAFFFWQALDCELCRTPYPVMVDVHHREVELFEIARPKHPYIILEPRNQSSKGMYVISLSNKKIVKLGRGHFTDVRFSDISVSRLHATVRYHKGTLLLEDFKSKFGTLVEVRKPIKIDINAVGLAVQTGRTVIWFGLSHRWNLRSIPNCLKHPTNDKIKNSIKSFKLPFRNSLNDPHTTDTNSQQKLPGQAHRQQDIVVTYYSPPQGRRQNQHIADPSQADSPQCPNLNRESSNVVSNNNQANREQNIEPSNAEPSNAEPSNGDAVHVDEINAEVMHGDGGESAKGESPDIDPHSHTAESGSAESQNPASQTQNSTQEESRKTGGQSVVAA